MAGIGFELRKLLKRDSYLSLIQAYTYAGIIGAGPWVLSILGVQAIGFMSLAVVVPDFLITQFQVSVTHLIAGSLILTDLTGLTEVPVGTANAMANYLDKESSTSNTM